MIDLELPNLSLILDSVPGSVFTAIEHDVDRILANDPNLQKINSALSAPGVPEHYRLQESTEELLKDYVLTVANSYQQRSLYLNSINILHKSAPYYFNRPWVNLQRQGEFLPNHMHEGILSYVIWVRIPKVIQNSHPSAVEGKLEFTYSNILGTNIGHNINLDAGYIGKILMFPASLRHCAYPFKGDEVRVSVSGNILLG